MGEIWIWLDPQEKKYVLELLRPEFPNIHTGHLALMTVNKVLDTIVKLNRTTSRAMGLTRLTPNGDWDIPANLKWLPGAIMPVWMKMYDCQRQVQKSGKARANDD